DPVPRERGAGSDRDDESGGHAPVVAHDEVPPEAAEVANELHASAVRRSPRRRRSSRTEPSEASPRNARIASSAESPPGPAAPAPRGRQEGPNRGRGGPAAAFRRVPGAGGGGRPTGPAAPADDAERRRGGDRRKPDPALAASERDHDEGDLEPLEEDALE